MKLRQYLEERQTYRALYVTFDEWMSVIETKLQQIGETDRHSEEMEDQLIKFKVSRTKMAMMGGWADPGMDGAGWAGLAHLLPIPRSAHQLAHCLEPGTNYTMYYLVSEEFHFPVIFICRN